MSYITHRDIKITLICYDKQYKKIHEFEVGNSFVQSFSYKRYRYGVEGVLAFFESHVHENNEVDIEEKYLSISHLIKIKCDIKNSAMVDESNKEDYSITLIGYSKLAPHQIYKVNYEKNIHFNSRLDIKKIQIHFADPLSVIAQFSCFDILLNSSYKDAFEKYLNLIDHNNEMINFTVSGSLKPLLDKKHLIVIACDTYNKDKKTNFYDYIIYIIKYYNLELVYDGCKQYKIIDTDEAKDYKLNLIDYDSMEKISLSMYKNSNYSTQVFSPFVNYTTTQNNKLSFNVLPYLHTDVEQLSSLLTKSDQNEKSCMYMIDLEMNDVTGLHDSFNKNYNINVSIDDNISELAPKIFIGKKLKIIEFEYNIFGDVDISQVGKSSQNHTVYDLRFLKTMSAFKFVDFISSKINYPQTQKIVFPIHAQGIIKTKEAKDKYEFSINNVDSIDKDNKVDYEVEIPYIYNNEKKPIIIKASQLATHYDQFFYPYANQTIVNLSLYMETALVDSASLFTIDHSLINQNEQTNLINMGKERLSYLKYNYKNEKNQIEVTNINSSTKQSISLIDKAVSLIYSSS